MTADPVALPGRSAPVPNFPDNAAAGLGGNRLPTGQPGNLNYIAVDSGAAAGVAVPASQPTAFAPLPPAPQPVAAPLPASATDGAVPAATTAPGANAAAPSDAGAPAPAPAPRERRAALGTAGIAVPSADGPLDVYVIDGGVRARADTFLP